MAFLQSEEGLIREQWPQNIGIVLSDPSEDALPPSRVFATDIETLSTSYTVQHKVMRPPSRPWGYTLLYNHDATQAVTIRLQGFIKNMSLQTLGTWNGRYDN